MRELFFQWCIVRVLGCGVKRVSRRRSRAQKLKHGSPGARCPCELPWEERGRRGRGGAAHCSVPAAWRARGAGTRARLRRSGWPRATATRAGPPQTARRHAAPIGFFLPLLPRGPSHPPSRIAPLKKQQKGSATQSPSATRPLADVAGRPQGASAQPRAFQRGRPNRRRARAAVRGDRSPAHARGGGSRAVTSGSCARAVPGRCPARRPAVRAGDAAWRSREARRRGSAGCPESGRCAGGGRRPGQPLSLPVDSVCAHSARDGAARRPQAGAVPGAAGRGCGPAGCRSRECGAGSGIPLRDLGLLTPLASGPPCARGGARVPPSPTVLAAAGLEGA